jgi:hypothetical protein
MVQEPSIMMIPFLALAPCGLTGCRVVIGPVPRTSLHDLMKPPFGFQNAPIRHLASIGSFIIALLICISVTLGRILNGHVGQLVAKMKGATEIKFWLG